MSSVNAELMSIFLSCLILEMVPCLAGNKVAAM